MKLYSLVKPRCAACGWIRCSGTISYGTKHEHHCASCLADWESTMRRAAEPHVNMTLTLPIFRNWQAERKQRMAA